MFLVRDLDGHVSGWEANAYSSWPTRNSDWNPTLCYSNTNIRVVLSGKETSTVVIYLSDAELSLNVLHMLCLLWAEHKDKRIFTAWCYAQCGYKSSARVAHGIWNEQGKDLIKGKIYCTSFSIEDLRGHFSSLPVHLTCQALNRLFEKCSKNCCPPPPSNSPQDKLFFMKK